MKKELNIAIIVPGMPFDGDTPKMKSLGGSETAAICMAKELVNRGHILTVLTNLPNGEKEIDGVTYADIQRAADIVQKVPKDVTIAQRDPRYFGYVSPSKLNALWNHDVATKAMSGQHQVMMWNIDFVFLLSKFHVEQSKSIYSFLDDDHIRLSRNGINLDEFKNYHKKKKKVIYGARPERGLENLVKPNGIMSKLYGVDPDIHLYVVGYDNTVPSMAEYYQYLWGQCSQLPNVTHLGSLNKADLYEEYGTAELYLYPTEFEEISCISAMECMASGTPFITTPKAALPETLNKKTAIFIDGDPRTDDYQDRFIGEVLSLIGDRDKRRKISFQCRERAKAFSWSGVAKEWEDLFFEEFEKRTSDKRKLVRHFLYRDDVIAAWEISKKYHLESDKDAIFRDYEWAFSEGIRDQYDNYAEGDKVEYPTAEQVRLAHLNDFLKGGAIGKRWPMVQNWCVENCKEGDSILDYGCGMGHFSNGFGKMGFDVIGTDFADKNVDMAGQLSIDLGLKNCVFSYFDTDLWDQPGSYDVIFLGDVLEHIRKPIPFLKGFENLLKEDGKILITTPFGPTRMDIGRDKGDKLHLHEFEYQDIADLAGKKEGFQIEILYWKHTRITQELLGWYLWSFGDGGEFGEIDLERKEKVQRPRQELSVCLIAKDEEDCIGKCFKSIAEIADEIIMVDTGSKDSTKLIAEKWGARVLDGSNPMKVGFEFSRNESIQPAKGDWILWVDADEELLNAKNIQKYLRESVFDGFRIRQHHFSCDPQNVVHIDKPVRLFRNNKGIKFFGLVHEHPGYDMNDGVGNVIELGDVEIAHGGYYTEGQRREKFWRNLDLMKADISKYPERWLSRFLYMRDLLQLVQWSVEQVGLLNEEARRKCVEIVHIYRNIFLPKGGFMMVDGLQYYDKALRFLRTGYDFKWSVNVGFGDVNFEEGQAARFADVEDFLRFVRMSAVEKIAPLTGPYVR